MKSIKVTNEETKNQPKRKSIWQYILVSILILLIVLVFYRRVQLNSGALIGSSIQQMVNCLTETKSAPQGCNSQGDEVQVQSHPTGGWELSGRLTSSRQCFAFGNSFAATYPAPIVASVARINGTLIKPHAGSLDEYALNTACNEDNTDLKFIIKVPKDVDPESKAIEILNGRT
ncbi:hypothetical protein ACO0LB_17940 [Undibacterium sp. SXout7W]|uniref:hypothetical protein n=1 Tax=Undibacterium sp. SXout7W TaxID=3413049 RepID=UPI003BEF94E5